MKDPAAPGSATGAWESSSIFSDQPNGSHATADPSLPPDIPQDAEPGAASSPAEEMGPTARRGRAGRPGLHVGAPPVATEWLRENIGKGPLAGLFARDSQIVYAYQEGEDGYISAADGGSNGPAQVQPVTAMGLTAIVQGTYDCYKNTERKTDPSDDNSATVRYRERVMFPRAAALMVVEVLHTAPNLRPLKGVVHSPLVRKDGSILCDPGYDEATQLLYYPSAGLIVPEVSANPSREQIADALKLLNFMVSEFRFVTASHRANYYGLLLTPILRELAPHPYKMGVFTAPQPGSGKGYLAQIIRTVHGGVFRSAFPRDEAEVSKQITSILDATTAPVCQFDNVTGTLSSGTLDGLLTSDVWEVRRLNTQTQISRPNDRLWLVTGNNVCIGGDLVRRTVTVTIDPGVPDPHLRTDFVIRNLPVWTRDHRGDLIAALLTLVSAWVAAGRPTRDARGSDSFAQWIETIDGILYVAGVQESFDAPETVSRTTGTDDDEWAEFLTGIRAVFGDGEGNAWTVRELLSKLDTPLDGSRQPSYPMSSSHSATTLRDVLPSALAQIEHKPGFSKSVGKWLANRDKRWAGRLSACEARGLDRTNAKRWYIKTPSAVVP
jgi:hypothetical protein